MNKTRQCREVRKLILGGVGSDGGCASAEVSGHVSQCERCRSLYAVSQGVERALAAERLRLIEVAADTETAKSRVLAEAVEPMPKRQSRRLRLVWAGVALVPVIVGAALLFPGRKGENRLVVKPSPVPAPVVTRTTVVVASSRTVLELAEAAGRHEAPPLELPYKPLVVAHESLIPRLLEESCLNSEDTLKGIVQSKLNLTRRNET